jgi:hypothetical protein
MAHVGRGETVALTKPERQAAWQDQTNPVTRRILQTGKRIIALSPDSVPETPAGIHSMEDCNETQ